MNDMYFTPEPTSEAKARQYELLYAGKSFVFHSSTGVFSKNGPDRGSLVLLDGCRRHFGPIGHGLSGNLLDLGCGIGLIGVVLKRLYPDLRLVMADCNRRALELARENCAENRIGYTEILASDAWEGLEGRTFDFVVSNPPIRAGKTTVYAFFAGAARQLRPGGQLLTVISKNQGADSARKELLRLFGNVETIHRAKAFHVLLCEKGVCEKRTDESPILVP